MHENLCRKSDRSKFLISKPLPFRPNDEIKKKVSSTKKAESQSLETQSQRKLLPYQLPTGHSIRCPTFKGSYRKKAHS